MKKGDKYIIVYVESKERFNRHKTFSNSGIVEIGKPVKIIRQLRGKLIGNLYVTLPIRGKIKVEVKPFK